MMGVKFNGRALGLVGWAGGCFQRYFTNWLAFNHVVNCKVEHLGGVWVHGLVTACEVQHEPYPQTLGRQMLLPVLLVGCGALLSVWGADWEFYPLTRGHLSMHITWPLALDMALGFCSNSAGIVIMAFRMISSVVALRVGGEVSLFSDEVLIGLARRELEKVSLPVDGLKHRLAELHVPHWVHLDLTKCNSNQHAFVIRELLWTGDWRQDKWRSLK